MTYSLQREGYFCFLSITLHVKSQSVTANCTMYRVILFRWQILALLTLCKVIAVISRNYCNNAWIETCLECRLAGLINLSCFVCLNLKSWGELYYAIQDRCWQKGWSKHRMCKTPLLITYCKCGILLSSVS